MIKWEVSPVNINQDYCHISFSMLPAVNITLMQCPKGFTDLIKCCDFDSPWRSNAAEAANANWHLASLQ